MAMTFTLYPMARRPREYTPDEKILLAAVAARIRAHRLAAGLSQEELADLAKLSRSHISKVENPNSDLQLITLVRLARALKIPLSELVNLEEGTATHEG